MDTKTLRIGIGYDVHRFGPRRKLVLGGVTIPHDRGLIGHSDADVLLHAICDALLGAAAMGDIGKYFPNTDKKWKNVSSLSLLSSVGMLLHKKGFTVGNVDGTVILEDPKISPHVAAMRRSIARALRIPATRVSVKATTNERLGSIGSGEGCAAVAVASVSHTVSPRGA
jgi:2-C-methyl-D-erythritol 2,4-cyclodiphosphate synthase